MAHSLVLVLMHLDEVREQIEFPALCRPGLGTHEPVDPGERTSYSCALVIGLTSDTLRLHMNSRIAAGISRGLSSGREEGQSGVGPQVDPVQPARRAW